MEINKILVMPISYGHFDDQVIHCVNSILQYEPGANILIVDNGSLVGFNNIAGVERWKIQAPGLAPLSAYAKILPFYHGWDWAVFLNADVRCTGKFLEVVSLLDPQQIHGNSLYDQNGTRWIDAWCFIFSQEFWRKVGPPDGAFEIPGHFQDCDYCLQGLVKGFECHETALPFVHLETKTGMMRPDFWDARERNRQRVHKNHGFCIGA
jgi:hypothetical protein